MILPFTQIHPVENFHYIHKKNDGNIYLVVLNAQSKIILTADIDSQKEDATPIDLKDQPPGLYYIIMESGSAKTMHKVVIQ